ncbi:MAG TPA: hypothetical protein VNW15_13015 [Rhizomicrobium sp.]|nr:hypothetical protein [Rhizomicrobium sp.]
MALDRPLLRKAFKVVRQLTVFGKNVKKLQANAPYYPFKALNRIA